MLVCSHAQDLCDSVGGIAKIDGVSDGDVNGSGAHKPGTGHADVGIDEKGPEHTNARGYNEERQNHYTSPFAQRLATP